MKLNALERQVSNLQKLMRIALEKSATPEEFVAHAQKKSRLDTVYARVSDLKHRISILEAKFARVGGFHHVYNSAITSSTAVAAPKDEQHLNLFSSSSISSVSSDSSGRT
jgi:hypothetical protein